MTLDEAIKHCEKRAKENRTEGCIECAKDHEQLAEWLKELKEYREFAHYLARLIFREQLTDDFEAEKELICRKLNKLGIIEKTEKEWIYKESKSE